MKKSLIVLLVFILSFCGYSFAQDSVKESDKIVVTALKKDTRNLKKHLLLLLQLHQKISKIKILDLEDAHLVRLVFTLHKEPLLVQTLLSEELVHIL